MIEHIITYTTYPQFKLSLIVKLKQRIQIIHNISLVWKSFSSSTWYIKWQSFTASRSVKDINERMVETWDLLIICSKSTWYTFLFCLDSNKIVECFLLFFYWWFDGIFKLSLCMLKDPYLVVLSDLKVRKTK